MNDKLKSVQNIQTIVVNYNANFKFNIRIVDTNTYFIENEENVILIDPQVKVKNNKN